LQVLELFSEALLTMAKNDTIIYIGGTFEAFMDDNNYTNIAKYDTNSMKWLPIEPLTAIVGTKRVVYGLHVANSNLYAIGYFNKAGLLSVNNIAGCDGNGVWVDDLQGGPGGIHLNFNNLTGCRWRSNLFNRTPSTREH
jgi:hypothetical protein